MGQVEKNQGCPLRRREVRTSAPGTSLGAIARKGTHLRTGDGAANYHRSALTGHIASPNATKHDAKLILWPEAVE